MDLAIKTKDLQSALSLAAATTDRGKSTVPIVTQVFLTADGDTLTIRSTDAERSMTSVVPCAVKLVGEASLNFSRLQSTVNLLTADDVRIKLNKNHRVEITSGKSTSRIPAEEHKFPAMDTADGLTAEVKAESLANALRQMMPTVSSKAEDEGVIEISSQPGVMRLVAINLASAHRLGVTQFACGAPEDFRFMAHYDSAQAIRKMLSGVDGHAIIKLGTNGTSVEAGTNRMYFLKRDKKMPAVENILSKRQPSSAQVETKELVSALRRTLNFYRKDANLPVPGIDFASKDGALELSFASQDCESNELLDAVLDGNPPSFQMNGEYILTFMAEVWNKSVEIRYGGKRDTVYIKPTDAEYPLAVINPLYK